MLHERFKDDLTFAPIFAESAIDPWDTEYLEILIVFAGDFNSLDTKWTPGLPVKLWPKLDEWDIKGVPAVSFVEKSEWEDIYQGTYPSPNGFNGPH